MRLLSLMTVGLKGKRRATPSILPSPPGANFNEAAKSHLVAVLLEDF
jgi:hypothetical protein